MSKPNAAILGMSHKRMQEILSHFSVSSAGCHELTRNGRGHYGQAKVLGVMVGVHRIALFKKTGIIGVIAMHACDNPKCINPDHLSWGTASLNCQDKIAKGRANWAMGSSNGAHTKPHMRMRGQSHGRSKLTQEQVAEIRSIGASRPQRSVAASFGVRQQIISKILRNENWKQS